MKENERRVDHLSVCTVVIPELDSDRLFDGICSINDRLTVWIDCRSGSYEDYNQLYDLCASNDLFTVKVSGPLGEHTGFNCFCNSPVHPVTYLDSGTKTMRNEPNPGEFFLELYCNFWLEGKMVASMNNDKIWRVIGISFPNSYYWFRCLEPGTIKRIETDIGILEFGISKSCSSSIIGKNTYDCCGYVKVVLHVECSCEEAIDYTVMFQVLVRFVSGIPFTIEDIVLAQAKIKEPRITLHGNYGIRESNPVTVHDYCSIRHPLSDLSEEGVRSWVRWWQKGNILAIITFEKNRNAKVYSRVVDGIKCFDGISSSLWCNTLYNEVVFKDWINSLLDYIEREKNPLKIPRDRISGQLNNLNHKSLRTRVKEVLEDNNAFPKVNSDNRSKIVSYLCNLRNIDSHRSANKKLENDTKLSLFELEDIATKMVYLIVDKEVLFLE